MINWVRILAGFVFTLAALGCSDASRAPDAIAMQKQLTASCIGEIVNSELAILGAGYDSVRRPLPADVNVSTGRISRRGNIILGWNPGGLFTLAVGSGQTLPLARLKLTTDEFDLSADGSQIAWVGRDAISGQTGLLILDTESQHVELVAAAGRHPSLSPDGSAIAYEDGPSVKIQINKSLKDDLKLEGTLPSWAADGSRVAYRAPSGSYRIVDIRSGKSREVSVIGSVVSPLQWSGDGKQFMYVTRTWRDYWLAPLSCTERHRVVIQGADSDRGVVFHIGCELHPERIHWINAESICSG